MGTVYKPEGRYVGYCGVYPTSIRKGDAIPGEGILAFYLARPFWGRGLATEAGRAFLRFGFELLGLSRIVATVQTGNDASVRVLVKHGFRRVGTEIGETRSYYTYEITRPAWAAALWNTN